MAAADADEADAGNDAAEKAIGAFRADDDDDEDDDDAAPSAAAASTEAGARTLTLAMSV